MSSLLSYYNPPLTLFRQHRTSSGHPSRVSFCVRISTLHGGLGPEHSLVGLLFGDRSSYEEFEIGRNLNGTLGQFCLKESVWRIFKTKES